MAEFLVPHTFTAGTKAKAAEVNANFTACKSAIDTNSTDIEGINTSLLNVVTKDGVTDLEQLQSYKVRTITDATNATPIVITSTSHGFSTGDNIYIAGIEGNSAANDEFTITKVDDDTFSLNGSVGNGAYITGGYSYLFPKFNEDIPNKKYVDRRANNSLPTFCVNSASSVNLLSYSGLDVSFAAPFVSTDKNGDTFDYSTYSPLTIVPIKYENIASTGTSISSGDFNTTLSADNAFDGSLSTYWASALAGSGVTNTSYVGKTFSSTITIDAIVVKLVGLYSGTFNFLIQEYDGTNWTTIYTSENYSTSTNYTFEQTRTAKGWRVLCGNTTDAYGDFHVFELQILQKNSSGSLYLEESQNIFDEYGNAKAYSNNIYRQTTQPSSPKTNDVWQDISVKPFAVYKYDGSSWKNYNGVPLGSVTLNGSGAITAVATLPYNQNGFDLNVNTLKRYPVETYSSGSSYYTVYSDGWIEQGGCTYIGNADSPTTITFLKGFSTSDIDIICQVKAPTDENTQSIVRSVSAKSFVACNKAYGNSGVASYVYWQACGY